MCLNMDLSSWRLVLELFLREDVSHCGASLLRIQKKVSIYALFVSFSTLCFALLLVLLVNFGLRTNLDVRFGSLDFFFSP